VLSEQAAAPEGHVRRRCVCAGADPRGSLTLGAPQNANLSDVLMDRAVLNEANLRNANLQRTIFTRCCLPPCSLGARMRRLWRLRVRINTEQLDKRMRGVKLALLTCGGVCWNAPTHVHLHALACTHLDSCSSACRPVPLTTLGHGQQAQIPPFP